MVALVMASAAVSVAQECGTQGGVEQARLETDDSVTLDLTTERPREDCNGNDLCLFNTPGFQGDWTSVTGGIAQISWHTGGCNDTDGSADLEGVGDVVLDCSGSTILSDDQFSNLISTLAANNGMLKLTNTGDLEIIEFEILILSEDMCVCFEKTQVTEVVTWTNGAGGDFSTDSNWDKNRPPAEGNTAKFDLSGAYTVSLSMDVETDAALVEGGGSMTLDLSDKLYSILRPDCSPIGIQAKNAILTLTDGEIETVGNVEIIEGGSILATSVDVRLDAADIYVGGTDGRGSMTVSDSSRIHVATPGVVDVGSDLNSRGGDLLIEEAGALEVDAAVAFADDGGTLANASSGKVTGPGSKLVAQLLVVGGKGEATLSLTDSAYASVAVLDVGSLVGGFGTVNVEDSATVELQQGFGRLRVGGTGRGFFNVDSDGTLRFKDGVADVGADFNGNGRVRVDGQGALVEGGLLKVGIEGRGEVFVRNHGSVEVDNLEIASGVSSSATSRVTVEGSGSIIKVKASAPVWIARAGRGELAVLGGGKVILPDNLYVSINQEEPGPQGPADGSVRVSGTNSLLDVEGEMRLGVRSSGNVSVETGGTIELGKAGIGYLEGSGVVRIRSNGKMTVGQATLGVIDTTAYGEVQVEDSGSEFAAQSVTVGGAGRGLLNTFSGGVAAIGSLTVNNGTVRGNVQIGTGTPKSANSPFADSLGWVTTDTLLFNAGATIEADSAVFSGGFLGGSGRFPFDVVNTGVISPGNGLYSIGTLTVDASYLQISEGMLHIEFGGPIGSEEYDRLAVAGTASLGGTLRVTVLSGPTPPVAGREYVIINAASIEGVFQTVELQEGLEGNLNYGDSEVTFTVTGFVPVAFEEVTISETPTEIALSQNYPNPFNSSTTIQFSIPRATHVRLTVFDALGRNIALLGSGPREAGTHVVSWASRSMPSGVYFYRLEAGGVALTRSMFLAK